MGTLRSRTTPRLARLVFFLLAVAPAAALSEQPEDAVLLRATSSLDVRVSESSTEVFHHGGGANLAAGITMPFFRPLAVLADLGYHFIPVKTRGTTDPFSLSLLSAQLTLDVRWVVFSRLELSLGAGGGYFFGFITEDPTATGQGFVGGYGATVSCLVSPKFSAGVAYRENHYLGLDSHMALGVVVSVGF